MKTRILIADDHETVREGLKAIVNSQTDMEVIGEAGNGISAVNLAQELQPDVIVMDISMPEMNGLKATAKIKKLCPQVKVLTLSRHTDGGYLQELLRAGASGYILKQSAASELIHALRAVIAGGKYIDPTIAEKVLGGYTAKPVKTGFAPNLESITEREAEVLRLVAWGYSNKEIAARLKISVKTVEAHKTNSMKKLEMRSRIDIVRFALLQGWLQDT
ncbi:MAG: response regulator transcription factor [Pyrinomonadaceae bacterium]